jgi:uroporphyrinogen-III synthase
MKLIVTRPLADAIVLAKQLEQRGHTTIIAPLLNIVARSDVSLPNEGWQALCVTSANGLLRADLVAPLRKLPVYCVGPQSARGAELAGLAEVRQRGGDVKGLASAIASELHPEAGPILYLSGSETSGDLEGKLSAHGFAVHRAVTYDAMPLALQLTSEQWQAAEGVLLYSPRSARLWAEAVAASAVARANKLVHFCLSANVARNLPHNWRARVAARPDEEHMLSMLDRPAEAE